MQCVILWLCLLSAVSRGEALSGPESPIRTGGVILYGGHFSPPHWTHLREAEAAMRAVRADRVILIPSAPRAIQHEGARRQRAWLPVPAHARFAMTWLAIRGLPGFEASPIEAGRSVVGYSSGDTILEIAGRLPERVWVLMGTDVFRKLPEWERGHEVLREVDILVTEYPPDEVEPLDAYFPQELARQYQETSPGCWSSQEGRSIRFYRFETGAIRSGTVRQAIQDERPIENLVPALVARYIARFGLYRRGRAGGPPGISPGP